jgi:hypothetical protein
MMISIFRPTIAILVIFTHPVITLMAPSGVTRIAGAKLYALKLSISPSATF